MKSILIVLLTLALLAAAFATRPGKREFVLYLLDSQPGQPNYSAADSLAKDVAIADRLLWTDIVKDGKVIYSGAFSHFIARGDTHAKPLPSAQELAKVLPR